MALQGMHMLLRPYDARFKLHQKLQSPVLNERASNAYLPFQELETRQMLFDIVTAASSTGQNKAMNCHGYMERTTASIIYSLLYGHRVWSADDPILINCHEVNHEFDQLAQVGKYLVDSFPVLNNIPLPGFLTPWKKEAASHWLRQRALHMGNLDRAVQGNAWNFSKEMQQILTTQAVEMAPEELALNIGIMADAALDASTETMMWFVVACITSQEPAGWVVKAQALLDAAVGRERLPTFEDRPKLPYIDAIIEELLRWRPAGAAGVPHFGKVESVYNGFRIPANSVVIPNHWAMTRDQNVYGPDVEVFRPERFMGSQKLPTVGFGFGRRICPGRHVARNSLWISISRLLWAFDIKPASSEAGGPPDDTKGTDGLVTKPLPFEARFELRDQSAQDVIRRECNTHAVDFAAMLDQIGSKVLRTSGDGY